MADTRKEEFALQTFNGTQYDKWRYRLKLFLEMKECHEVIENEEKPSTIKDIDWNKKEIRAKNYIVNGVTDTQLEMIITQKTARDMIRKLDEMYLIKSSAVKLMCKRKLLELKLKEGEDPVEFFNDFEKLINELNNAGENVSKDDKLNYLLLALPDSLSHIVDVIDVLSDKDRSVEYVKSKLTLDYQKKQCISTSVKNDFQAFSSHTSKNNKNYNTYHKSANANRSHFEKGSSTRFSQDRNRSNNYTKRCYRCNQMGHIQRFCKNNSNWQARSARTYDFKRTAGISEVENNYKNSFNVVVMETELESEVERKISAEENMEWLLDSGCSDHIVNSDKYFSKSQSLENPVDIKVGDGFSLKSDRIGNINIWFNVYGKWVRTEIKNVYYVPNMKKNLLSVPCILDNQNHVVFKNRIAKVINRECKLIAMAVRRTKLFELVGKVQHRTSEHTSYITPMDMTKKEKWHRILGHVNFKDLQHLCDSQLLEGLPKRIENEFLKCEICLENKMTNLKFKNDRCKAHDLLEIVHTDVNGPMTQTGYAGEKYFISFIDDFSKIAVVYCIKNKSEVSDKFVDYMNMMRNHTGKRIKEIRCDNGKEYLNKEIFALMKREGIRLRPCPPYTHELNGVAERYNRTIMNRARCLLAEAKIDKRYWPECIYAAAYIGNRLPANTRIDKTPFEIFFNKKPNVSNLRLYGSKTFVRIPEVRRPSKLHPKSAQGILIGYTDLGYKVLIGNKVIISRNVQFIEKDMRSIKITEDDNIENTEKVISYKDEDDTQEEPMVEPENEKNEEEDEDKIEEVKSSRPKRTINKPQRFGEHIVYVNYCSANVPESYEEAINCPESNKWIKAMEEEINSLEENETWTPVDKPINKKIVDVKWIYRIKSDGKYKARVVARGFQQSYQENEEIYSPVARANTLKILLSVACIRGWYIEQMDVQTAFLNGKIKSEVYIYPPDGYNIEVNKVCLVNKSLYGLERAHATGMSVLITS